jgi:hypothetical protein
MPPPGYSPSSYDDNFCLKPPALLWLAALYLSRAFVLLLASNLVTVIRMDPSIAAMLRGAVNVYSLLPSVIAALVLYALVFRAPSSTRFIRWIWGHGRSILALAAILDCAALIVGSGMIGGDVSDLAAGPLVATLFDIYFLIYILATRRVRDVFASFPPPPESAAGPNRARSQ